MTFARQFTRTYAPILPKIINRQFVKTDPCLNCSLPFDCDEGSKECRYVQITGRKVQLEPRDDEKVKADILAILGKLIEEKNAGCSTSEN